MKDRFMNNKNTQVLYSAKEILRVYGYFIDNLWHVDDIHFLCEQKKLPKITNREAMEVFIIANEQFDGEVGLCWARLEDALTQYLRRKALLADSFIKDCV